MGKQNTSKEPPAPNPQDTIKQTTQSNVATAVSNAYLNNVDQVTPYGKLTYQQTGTANIDGRDIPTFTATTTLSPEQQKLYETQTQISQGTSDLANQYVGRIAEATAQPFNYDGLPNAPVYNDQYRTQQRDAIIQRNQPQMDRDRMALEQRLADQGIGLEDPAYRAAMDDYNRGINDFRLGADLQSGNAAGQQFGLEAQTRDRAIAERTNLRTQPINEVATLLGTGSGVRDPSFVPTNNYQIQPTDVGGIIGQDYATRYGAWNQQNQQAQASQNAMLGGLFGLGGTLGGGYLYGRGRG